MAHKKPSTAPQNALLLQVQAEMAKPRIAASAQIAESVNVRVFPRSGSEWPGLGRPARHRITPHLIP